MEDNTAYTDKELGKIRKLYDNGKFKKGDKLMSKFMKKAFKLYKIDERLLRTDKEIKKIRKQVNNEKTN